MHLDTKKCCISRDVTYLENVFSFHTLNNSLTESLFPSEMSSCDSPFDNIHVSLDMSDSIHANSDTSVPTTILEHNCDTISDPINQNQYITSTNLQSVQPSRTKLLPIKFKDYNLYKAF